MKLLVLNFLLLSVFIKFSLSNQCGKVKIASSFIAGGEESKKGQWPWMAPLLYKNNKKFFCSSSIISKKYLLGAAHCFHEKFKQPTLVSSTFTFLGTFDLSNENEVGSSKIDIKQAIPHPDWNSIEQSYNGDIAILVLARDITFNDFIQPICLPQSDANVINVKGTVAGFGFTENADAVSKKLRHVEITSIEHATCLYEEPDLAKVGSLKMFCAGERGKNPCKGDSGGGFYRKYYDQYEIYGIVSVAGDSDCAQNKYVLFSNVLKYSNWITSTTGVQTQKSCNKGLVAGECINIGDFVYSCHNCFVLALLHDGNLAIYAIQNPIKAIWDTKTWNKKVIKGCMQEDGNFVLYASDNSAQWSTGTSGNPGAYLEVQYDGQMAIWKDGKSLWASGPRNECDRKPNKLPLEKKIFNRDRECNKGLIPGECMKFGDFAYSCHKCFKLTLLLDGVLALYTTADPIRSHWSTKTAGKGVDKACMQTDGNFVLYTSDGQPVWSTGTEGNPGAYMEVQFDGQMAIWKDGKSLWVSGSVTTCNPPSRD